MTRKAIPRSVRFEVFKRDKFTCQYCGAKAPEAVLHLDHIHPVAEGGGDDILNLLTACDGCNGGKGARLLSDDSAITKQRDQLEALQERREQLEMMIQWRQGLAGIDDQQVDLASSELERVGLVVLNEKGRSQARRLIKKYGLTEVTAAIDQAAASYRPKADDGGAGNAIWTMVPKVLSTRAQYPDYPNAWQCKYIVGICRNRFGYIDEAFAVHELSYANDWGVHFDALASMAKDAADKADFIRRVTAAIKETEDFRFLNPSKPLRFLEAKHGQA